MASSSHQIRQLMNFILQEAHEKVNEINLKTEHDFNLEKQMLVHNAKLKIQEEYTQKEKDCEIQDRIARSSMVGESRVNKMTSRDELVQQLLSDATEEIKTISKGTSYSELLTGLIIQGMLKIEETDVVVHCREADIPLVEKVLGDATKGYVELMEKQASQQVEPNLTVSDDKALCLPADSPGGVVLTARGGRIVCDNTLAARLNIVYTEVLPKIREQLFPTQT